MPELTVLMPMRDAAAYVARAVESVLAQGFADFELLAIDNASQDGTRAIVAGFADARIRLLENDRDLGLTASLNRGLAEAKGELVARQDADDVSLPERFARQREALARRPGLAIVGAQGVLIDARGRRRGLLAHGCAHDSVVWELLFDNGFLHTSVMFRRDVVRGELGGYDPSFAYCQDRELWVRLVRRHQAANLPELLVECRFHPRALTATLGTENGAENARITPLALRELAGFDAQPEELELLARFRESRLGQAGLVPFLGLFERLRAAFEQRRPGATSAADFRRTLARQYLRLLFTRGAGWSTRLLALADGARRGYPVWAAGARAAAGRLGLVG